MLTRPVTAPVHSLREHLTHYSPTSLAYHSRYGLLPHYHPPVLNVSHPRFLRAAKLSWMLRTLDGDYLLPSGRPGSPVEMHPDYIQGGVYHLGPTPHAGHYRSFCRYRGSICVGDDGHAGSLATQSDVLTTLSNSYLLFLRQR